MAQKLYKIHFSLKLILGDTKPWISVPLSKVNAQKCTRLKNILVSFWIILCSKKLNFKEFHKILQMWCVSEDSGFNRVDLSADRMTAATSSPVTKWPDWLVVQKWLKNLLDNKKSISQDSVFLTECTFPRIKWQRPQSVQNWPLFVSSKGGGNLTNSGFHRILCF